MGTEPTIALSFLAGLLSFLSPCVVPLVPSYISFVGGTSAIDGSEETATRGRVLLRTALFVAGFTIVFVLLGIVFSGSGMLFSSTGQVINVIAGSVVIILGLNIIFDFWKILNMEARFHFQRRPAGAVGSVLIGMAFGAGWTPCIGPILASILFLAGTSGSIGTGILYLTAFSLGLGVPFLLAGAFMDRARALLVRLRPYLPAIKIASGVLLVAVGLLIAFGRLQQLSGRLLGWGARLSAWDARNPAASDWSFAIGTLVLLGLPLAFALIARAKKRERPPRNAGLLICAVIAAAGLALAALNLTGVISLAGWIAGWLRFSGL